MPNPNFIASLNSEQKKYARLVYKTAEKYGIDPGFAISIAFNESSFDPKKIGKRGEIGMMQVLPSTAEELGFSKEDLADVSKNIEAGIKYLVQAKQYTGNQPVLMAAFYNGGPGAVQSIRNQEPYDPRVKEYLKKLNSYGIFGEPPPAPKVEPAKDAVNPVEQKPNTSSPPDDQDAKAAKIEKDQAQFQREQGQYFGGATGVGASASSAIRDWWQAPKTATQASSATAAASTPTSGLPGAPADPAIPGASIMRQPPTQMGVPGTYPMATGPGSATANYARAFGLPEIEAGRALGMGSGQGETWDLIQKRQQALNRIEQMGGGFRENPRYGGLMTPAPSAGRGPTFSFAAAEPVAPSPEVPLGEPGGLRQLPKAKPVSFEPKPPPLLDRVTEKLGEIAKPITRLGRYAVPPLSLAVAGGEAADIDTERRKKNPDYLKMGLSGVAGLSGLAALYPPLTVPAGAVSLGASLWKDLYEKSKEQGLRPPPDSMETMSPAP